MLRIQEKINKREVGANKVLDELKHKVRNQEVLEFKKRQTKSQEWWCGKVDMHNKEFYGLLKSRLGENLFLCFKVIKVGA